ncbi:MAG: hypothetical protein WAW17_27885, partial [Rhodococcus sp. (in: high G+C Gram-positive bacteria)]
GAETVHRTRPRLSRSQTRRRRQTLTHQGRDESPGSDPDATPNAAETLEALTSLGAIAAMATPAA